MTAAQIAQRLNGRKMQSGFMARCPAHDDQTPSLSLKDTDDGRVLVHCHAGCEQARVVAALKSRGLWPATERRERSVTVAEYDYRDENGELLYQVVRFEPKDFRQRRPDGTGGWIWRKHSRQVLYRLREVLESPIVFLVEGERDVETLRGHGFVCTTNAGGASAPRLQQYTAALAGRECILIPDTDPPGRDRVVRVARALLGYAARIIVLELEGAKDVTQWFEQGHSEVELIREVEGQEVSQ